MQNFVLKSDEFINFDMSSTIHIAFCCTYSYVKYAGIVLNSVIKSSKRRCSFHIFAEDFLQDDILKLKKTAKNNECNILLHYVNDGLLKKFNNPGEFSYASYYRLFIPRFLSKYSDKVFYSDVDVCFLKDISCLWNIDMSDKCAFVVGIQGERHKNEGARIGVKNYFVSGGILINNKNWIDNSIEDKIINLLNSKEKYLFPDMDILNIVLDKKVIFIDGTYQYQYSISNSIDTIKYNPCFVNIPDDVKIIHYTGSIKPWHKIAKKFNVSIPFYLCLNGCEWNDIVLVEPKTYKEMHKLARLAKKEGEFLDVFYWYMKYILLKVKYLLRRL